MKKAFIYIGLIVAMLIWALTFIWAKEVLNTGISPTMLIFFRLSGVCVFLLPVFAAARLFRKIQRRDIGLFMIMSFFEPFLYFIGEANGIKLVTPNIASIIIATIPVFLPFFARIFIREKLRIINYVGIAVSFFGVLLIIIEKDGRIGASPLGLAYLFIAVFSAVLYTLIAKTLLLRYSPMFLSGIKIFVAWLYFIPVFLIFDLPEMPGITFSLRIIILILALGVFGNLIAYLFFNHAIKQLGASKASIFSNLIPVFTIIFSFYILQDQLSLMKLAGIGIALSGIYISQIQQKVK